MVHPHPTPFSGSSAAAQQHAWPPRQPVCSIQPTDRACCSLVATALIAASGAAALEKPSFKDIANGIDGVNDNTNGPVVIPGTNDGSSVFLGASIECSAEAWAARYRSSQSAYVYAGPSPPCSTVRAFRAFMTRSVFIDVHADLPTRPLLGLYDSPAQVSCTVSQQASPQCGLPPPWNVIGAGFVPSSSSVMCPATVW